MAAVTSNEKLSHLEWCSLFESNIPLAGVSTQAQKQVLLGGYYGNTWASTSIAINLAHMEWCSIFEPNIPLGVSSQGQRQNLIGGYPNVLWAAAPQNPGGGTLTFISYPWIWWNYKAQ